MMRVSRAAPCLAISAYGDGRAVIRWDKSFFADNRDVVFVCGDEKIRTRLGGAEVE